MEEFRKVKGYENYSVSNIGNVRNDKRNKILSSCLSRGHQQVILCENAEKKHWYIHKLMLLAFDIPNPDNKPFIDHKDGNRRIFRKI